MTRTRIQQDGLASGVPSKASVGLGNVDNTSDVNKPVSTAQAAADSAVSSAAASDATSKANASQAYAIQRANHTGTQAWSTVTSTPTTISGYGITDGVTNSDSRLTDSREWTASTVSQADAEAGTATDRVAWTVQRVWQAIAAWWNASAAKTKLDGIATGATANQTDSHLLDRANHTGTQAASTIYVSATDTLVGRSSAGAGAAEEVACTAFGRSLIDDADAAAARATLAALPINSPQAETLFSCVRYAAAGAIAGRRANGTAESREAANNILATFLGQGWDGVDAYRTGAAIYVTAQETFSATAAGSHIRFYTVPTGSTTLTERMKIDHDGEVGIGTSSPTALLDVNSDTIRLRTERTPASASATGNAGDICWNSTHLFICTATNTWRRIAHSTW